MRRILRKIVGSGSAPAPSGGSESVLRSRLLDGKATVAEGLRLYEIVTGRGESFPPEWEERVLRLCLRDEPDRADLKARLEVVLEMQGKWDELGGGRKQKPPGAGDDRLVPEAKARLEQILGLAETGLPSHGTRWAAYSSRTRESIAQLQTSVEVLHFAQKKIGFEHRGNRDHEGKYTSMYENELAASFPHFAGLLEKFADIDDSSPDTVYVHKGRLISNVLFYYSRVILSCLTSLPAKPDVILEIGGGYGAPARLWMRNPIWCPRCYVILDIPESLFFADVFLRKEFGSDSVLYVTSAADLNSESIGKFKFILVPLALHGALNNVDVDLVINTGSLQEMDEEWVDFYGKWLDGLRCRWFYTLNYFAQPVNALFESCNLYSPRLSGGWRALVLRWNPPLIRMQSERNFLEGLYEKTPPTTGEAGARLLVNHFKARAATGETFAELMDIVRLFPDPTLMYEVLKFAMAMPFEPKEALWLANRLLENPRLENRAEIEDWQRRLSELRAAGIEAYY